jgi:hypothetical protein
VLNSYDWRNLLWSRALADSEDDRVLGKGLGSFRANGNRFFSDEAPDAHSGYVQAIYEIGDVGLVTYAWLYVGTIFVVLVYRRRAPKLGWLVLGFLLVNLVENYSDNVPYYLPYNWYVWAMLGADLSLRYRRALAARQTAQSRLSVNAVALRAVAGGA